MSGLGSCSGSGRRVPDLIGDKLVDEFNSVEEISECDKEDDEEDDEDEDDQDA